MAKKPTVVKSKTAKKPVAKAKKTAAPAGMWKILEQKKAQIKEAEQARSEGRSTHGQGQAFHANPRDYRFSKFAGPRRKAG